MRAPQKYYNSNLSSLTYERPKTCRCYEVKCSPWTKVQGVTHAIIHPWNGCERPQVINQPGLAWFIMHRNYWCTMMEQVWSALWIPSLQVSNYFPKWDDYQVHISGVHCLEFGWGWGWSRRVVLCILGGHGLRSVLMHKECISSLCSYVHTVFRGAISCYTDHCYSLPASNFIQNDKQRLRQDGWGSLLHMFILPVPSETWVVPGSHRKWDFYTLHSGVWLSLLMSGKDLISKMWNGKWEPLGARCLSLRDRIWLVCY